MARLHIQAAVIPLNTVAELNAALAGRYDVDREIGAGGMATVYLARDAKHERRVALKVLKPELGAVLGVERFLAEIKVTANLQHPNLLPLFDSGEAAGLLFYVMPFVEGESLRVRLDREKQLPVDEAVRLATSIASALDYAHRHNVIHRDLKPENILLHEGQPVVADFGIALAVSNAGGGRITQTGLSLGTPHYMSPEQATGDRAIDARTDLYSLGAMTYEMLTGDPPHVGSTSQAIIARVLTEKPRSIRATRPNVPAHLEAAVEHALEKLPADRFASAKEFADALSGRVIVTSNATAATGAATAVPPLASRRSRGLAIAGVVIAAWAASLVATAKLSRPAVDAAEVRFSVDAPVGQVGTAAPTWFAVSPDGSMLAYVADAPKGGVALWVRPIGSTVARVIEGTDGAFTPFWSPDSRFVGYFSNRKLFKVDIAGGKPQRLCDIPAPVVAGGTWNRDDIIVFANAGRLYSVVAAGGEPEILTTRGEGEVVHRFPTFLPDGRRFLYSIAGPISSKAGMFVGSLDKTPPVRVHDTPSRAFYGGAGILLLARAGDVFAQRFDADRAQLSGEPTRVAGVAADQSGIAFSVSDNGVLAYRTGTASGVDRELRWFSRDGKPLNAIGERNAYQHVRLSSDDKRIAFTRPDAATGRGDIWTVDLANNIPSRLTFDSTRASDPTWMPGNKAVLYFSTRTGTTNFYVKTVGATNDSVAYESPSGTMFPEDVTRDGRFLLYHRPNQMMALPLTGQRTPIVLGDSTYGKDEGRFAPDGQWISYGSDETGIWEVHVATFPAFDNRRVVSLRGGVQGRWRADGKELFYLSATGAVMSLPVRGAGASSEFGAPVTLFQSPISSPANNVPQFEVARDGKRFLFIAPLKGAAAIDPITVVVNWQNALKK